MALWSWTVLMLISLIENPPQTWFKMCSFSNKSTRMEECHAREWINSQPNTPSHLTPHSVIKRILPSDQYDIDLNQDLYVLYGKRSKAAEQLGLIDPHDFDILPEISSDRINAVSDKKKLSGQDHEDFNVIKQRLIKSHGILMLITWPLLAVTAVLFPVFMKPAFQGGTWFQVRLSHTKFQYHITFQSQVINS